MRPLVWKIYKLQVLTQAHQSISANETNRWKSPWNVCVSYVTLLIQVLMSDVICGRSNSLSRKNSCHSLTVLSKRCLTMQHQVADTSQKSKCVVPWHMKRLLRLLEADINGMSKVSPGTWSIAPTEITGSYFCCRFNPKYSRCLYLRSFPTKSRLSTNMKMNSALPFSPRQPTWREGTINCTKV